MTDDFSTLRRADIKKILNRHRGAKSAIADALDIHPVNISQWLSGRGQSKRVGEACEAKARELLALEQQESA